MSSILEAEGIGIAFGGVRAVEAVSFKVAAGQVFSIIGPNGAGKTTLFNLVSGIYPTDSGRIRIGNRDVTGMRPPALARFGLSRTFQNLQIFGQMTVLENVMVGRHLRENHNLLAHLTGFGSGEAATRAAALQFLDQVGLSKEAGQVAANLSYGAAKRLEIARALATEPTVLLLDEPAAGCNAVETADIDHLLVAIAKSGVAVVLVEHDMKLVMSISDHVLVLDQGRVLTEGKPAEIANDPRVIAAYLGSGALDSGTSLSGGTRAAH